MKNITKIIIATLAICTIVSCNKIPQEKLPLSRESITFSKAGGTETVTTGAAPMVDVALFECDANWNKGAAAPSTGMSPLTYSLDWVSVSVNGTTLTVTAKENTTGQKRYASVQVFDVDAMSMPNHFTITQE